MSRKELLAEVRRVRERQARTLAVDRLDLDVLDAVIERLAGRCPDEERSTG